jgi:hypothetical protein
VIKKFAQYIKESKKPFGSITKEDIEDQFLRLKEVMHHKVDVFINSVDIISVTISNGELYSDMINLGPTALINHKKYRTFSQEEKDEVQNIKKRLESEFMVNVKINTSAYYIDVFISPSREDMELNGKGDLLKFIDTFPVKLTESTKRILTEEELDDQFLRIKEVLGYDYKIYDKEKLYYSKLGRYSRSYYAQGYSYYITIRPKKMDAKYYDDVRDELEQIKERMEGMYNIFFTIVPERCLSDGSVCDLLQILIKER